MNSQILLTILLSRELSIDWQLILKEAVVDDVRVFDLLLPYMMIELDMLWLAFD